MATDIQTWLLERGRKEYQEDAFKWLHERFSRVEERINNESAWQANESKSFAQNAMEGVERGLVATRELLVSYVTIIAMIALASARLWIGVAGVALLLAWRRWWVWLAQKQDYRLDRFRQRFRELLKRADDREMLAEDKEFLRKCADSILFPYALATTEVDSGLCRFSKDAIYLGHGREIITAFDLWHVETLYREYCHGTTAGAPENCARRVREHIESVLSNFEAAIESARQTLITQIDTANPQGAVRAKDFLEDYREWERHYKPGDTDTPRDDKLLPFPLLKALRDKECWTFEEADAVRELCRKEELWRESAKRVFDKLSPEMEAAAVRSGLEQTWKLYEWKSWFLQVGSTSSPIRRIIARRNPEAMFRELREDIGLLGPWRGLGALTNYGYDSKMVWREYRTAEKLIAKEGGKLEKCYKRELAAAQAFARVEELVQEQRRKELFDRV